MTSRLHPKSVILRVLLQDDPGIIALDTGRRTNPAGSGVRIRTYPEAFATAAAVHTRVCLSKLHRTVYRLSRVHECCRGTLLDGFHLLHRSRRVSLLEQRRARTRRFVKAHAGARGHPVTYVFQPDGEGNHVSERACPCFLRCLFCRLTTRQGDVRHSIDRSGVTLLSWKTSGEHAAETTA